MSQFLLSLGSNLEPRAENLKKALNLLAQGTNILRTSALFENPPHLPPQAPREWYHFFLNTVVLVETSLSAFELLQKSKQIEQEMGRDPTASRWSPRIIDIDIVSELQNQQMIAGPQQRDLSLPHPRWQERNFVISPLAQILPHGKSPCGKTFLQWHRESALPLANTMAILNVTPDSFSQNPQENVSAIERLQEILKHNPAYIDIGAESTRPEAQVLTPELEWQRLEPVLTYWKELASQYPFTRISVDTYHPETAKKILAYKVHGLNDVTGLKHPQMKEVANHFSEVFIMHSLTVPADPKITLPATTSASDQLLNWYQEKKQELCFLPNEKIVIDPGIGFGKTALQSLEILQNLNKWSRTENKILIGHSRKSFLRLWSTQPAYDLNTETLGVSVFLMQNAANILRVHDLEGHQRLLRSHLALRNPL